jgi:hypothetical protein
VVQLHRIVAYAGRKFIVAYARDKSGASPGADFFEALDLPEKAKLMNLFRLAADHASFYNPEKFGDLGAGLFESSLFKFGCLLFTAKNEASF